MRVKKRPTTVRAEQFLSTIPALSRLMQNCPERTGQLFYDWPILVDYEGPYCIIYAKDGSRRLNPTDWIITEEDGKTYPVSDFEFKRDYETVAL